MTLGQRIQELRKQNNLSQQALGERLGVSRQAISRWEMDGAVPEVDKLIAMSKLFGVSLNELLGVEEAPRPQPDRRARRPWLMPALCALLAVALAVSLGRNFYYRNRVMAILDPPRAPAAPVELVEYAYRPDFDTMTYGLALTLHTDNTLKGYQSGLGIRSFVGEKDTGADSLFLQEVPIAFQNGTATVTLTGLPFRAHRDIHISLGYSKGERGKIGFLSGSQPLLTLTPSGRYWAWEVAQPEAIYGPAPDFQEDPQLLP